jgi:hypothetical protein
MVKISIKKAKKAKAKPKQKQKQTQSQKIIVNIGSNATRAKRRSTLEKKKAVNRSTPTPNIIIPQSMPQNSMNEIFKYIRDAEQQKEMIKKQEKNNELERDKLKEKKPPTIPTEEERAQVQFTVVNSRNISGISSGITTPQFNPLSTPLNFRTLQNALGALIDRADLEGENPNTGRISLSTYNPTNPLLGNQYVSSSNSSIITEPGYIDDNDSVLSYDSRTPLTHTPNQNSLIDILQNRQVEQEDEEEEDEEVYIEPETEEKTIINETGETETQGEPLETISNEPAEGGGEVIIETPEPEKTAYEQADEAITLIDQALNPNTESKQAEDLSVIGAQKTKKTKEPAPMIEIKRVDIPASNLGAPTTPYTRDQIKKMRLQKVGEMLTAERIKDKNGKLLLFNGGRIFPEGTLKDDVNLPDVKKRILLHYGYSD